MCGRFVLFSTNLVLHHGFDAPQGMPPPRYNIAPTQKIAIVRESTIEPARWGLIPHWKRDLTGPPLFNARAETVAEKPSFRQAFKAGRCVVPMDGYYEWKDKQPYYVTGPEQILWAAGLWATGMDQLSATIITTDATEETQWLHHRLPKFLEPSQVQAWLAGDNLLEPTTVSGFEFTAVGKQVGNVRNDFPELIEPVPTAESGAQT